MSGFNYYPPSILNITDRHFREDTLKNVFCTVDCLKSYPELFLERCLMVAALTDSVDVLHKLLESGVSVDAIAYNAELFTVSKNYMTPLQVAAARGNCECVHILIDFGANVNAKDCFNVTALHMAAEQGHLSCVRALLKANANCNIAIKDIRTRFSDLFPYSAGTTPLHLAANNNKVACVKELIQYGADYNAVDDTGRTGLYIAAQYGFSECVLTQLKNAVGRDILSLPCFLTGHTPLHFAVKRGMVHCVRELVRLGSDVSQVNRSDYSPLHLAVQSTDKPDTAMEILQLLVLDGYNLDINMTDGLKLTPLHYVSFNLAGMLIRRPEMAKLLIQYGADVNIRTERGISLLQYEYYSPDSDMKMLKTIVQAMTVLPLPSQLRHLHSSSAHPIQYHTLNAFWLALRNRELPHAQQGGPVIPNEVKKQWYEFVATNPRPLMHYCRSSIRTAIGYKQLRRIKDLPIPEALVSYLLLERDD